MENKEIKIVATMVSDSKRNGVLPKYFGCHCVRFEGLVCDLTRKLCDAYDGGFWNYYELSNGGFYMALDQDEPMLIEWSDNYFSGEMSADAAGIVASFFALNRLTAKFQSERFLALYEALLSYIDQHPEYSLIRNAID